MNLSRMARIASAVAMVLTIASAFTLLDARPAAADIKSSDGQYQQALMIADVLGTGRISQFPTNTLAPITPPAPAGVLAAPPPAASSSAEASIANLPAPEASFAYWFWTAKW
jgi:hypothetical protein